MIFGGSVEERNRESEKNLTPATGFVNNVVAK
jgi:hypothetical protein